MNNRHEQLVRDRYLRDLHESMIKHKISFDELKEYAEKRYVNRADRMEEIRRQQQLFVLLCNQLLNQQQ